QIVRNPGPAVIAKVIDHIDDICRKFIAASPLHDERTPLVPIPKRSTSPRGDIDTANVSIAVKGGGATWHGTARDRRTSRKAAFGIRYWSGSLCAWAEGEEK